MSNKKILIIEDEKDVGEVYCDWINRVDGFEAKICSDGLTGSSALLKEKFDLVLMDLNLPFKSGEEIISFIRETELRGESVPIIIVSGNLNNLKAKFSNTQMLEKPVSQEVLVEKIKGTFKF